MKIWNVCFVPSWCVCVCLWWDLLKLSTVRPVRHGLWQKKTGPPNIDKVLRHIFTGSDLTKPWRTVKKLKIAWVCIPVSLLRHSRHAAVWTEEKTYAVPALALEMEISSGCKRYEIFVLFCQHNCAAIKCPTTSNTTTNYCSYVKACHYVWFLAVALGLA